jgi:hypothetical protein
MAESNLNVPERIFYSRNNKNYIIKTVVYGVLGFQSCNKKEHKKQLN